MNLDFMFKFLDDIVERHDISKLSEEARELLQKALEIKQQVSRKSPSDNNKDQKQPRSLNNKKVVLDLISDDEKQQHSQEQPLN